MKIRDRWRQWRGRHPWTDRFPGRDRPFVTERLARLPATTGNQAELLVDGEATFDSIFEGIARAENYVLVQFYIIKDDNVGRELKERLR